MRTDPRLLLRGFAKFVAVVVAAGVAGALIGIGLAKLSGDDASNDPVLPATAPQSSTSGTQTSIISTGTQPSTTATAPAKPVYRVPRVEVLSAQLGPVTASTGRALVTVRVRFTNRGNRAVTIKAPVLLSAQDEVALGSDARSAAGALLKPIDPAKSATGTLRFDLPPAIAQRLTATPAARVRIGNRTVIVKLQPSG